MIVNERIEEIRAHYTSEEIRMALSIDSHHKSLGRGISKQIAYEDKGLHIAYLSNYLKGYFNAKEAVCDKVAGELYEALKDCTISESEIIEKLTDSQRERLTQASTLV